MTSLTVVIAVGFVMVILVLGGIIDLLIAIRDRFPDQQATAWREGYQPGGDGDGNGKGG